MNGELLVTAKLRELRKAHKLRRGDPIKALNEWAKGRKIGHFHPTKGWRG